MKPTPYVEKNRKTKNDLHTMKQILYNIGPEKGLPTQKLKKDKCVLKWSLGKIQCFKILFFLFCFFLSGKKGADPPPPPPA